MRVILKIPKLHREFLQQKGALDHFVSAKLTGNDFMAKWTLLDSAKNEIKDIVDRDTQKFDVGFNSIKPIRKDSETSFTKGSRRQSMRMSTEQHIQTPQLQIIAIQEENINEANDLNEGDMN